MFGLVNTVVLALYLLTMLGVGLFFSRRQRTTEDYFLAGRNMPWFPVAMSMYASLTSATTYLALPGKAYSENIALLLVCLVSPCVAPVLIFLIYPFYRRLRATTSYEYIELRFGHPARLCTSAFFLLTRLGWLGTVIYAPALALTVVTDIPLWSCILFMGAMATTYTTLGGLAAVLWTDVVQFVTLVGGAIWIGVTLHTTVNGGVDGILQVAGAAGHTHIASWTLSLTETTGMMVVLCFFLQMTNDYGTDQVTVQRLMAIKKDTGVWKAIIFNAFSDLVIISLLLFIGLGIFAYYQQNGIAVGPNISPDQIMPHYIVGALPNGVSGLLIAAIFAAAMSSIDSGIHSMATVLEHDLLGAPKKESLLRVRCFILGLGAIATGLAFYVAQFKDIIKAFATIVSLFSAPILALFLIGMLTKRGSFPAWVLATIPAIGVTIWLQQTEINWTYYFPTSFTITFLGSLLLSHALPNKPIDPILTIYRT